MRAFLDTKILVCAVGADPRKERAIACLTAGGAASVQVLNEFASVARRKLGLGWTEVEGALGRFRVLLDPILALDLAVHDAAMALARDHNLAVYDALIVAAAQKAGRHAVQRGHAGGARLRPAQGGQPGLPLSGGPVSVLVHDGFGCHGRGGRRSGAGWRSRPVDDLWSWGPVAQR